MGIMISIIHYMCTMIAILPLYSIDFNIFCLFPFVVMLVLVNIILSLQLAFMSISYYFVNPYLFIFYSYLIKISKLSQHTVTSQLANTSLHAN